MFIFFAALNVWLAFTAPQDLHFRHLSCRHTLFRMNNIRDNQQASKDERFSETSRKINKDIVAPRKPSQIPVARKDCQVVRTAFDRFIANSVTAAVFMLSIWYSSRV